MESAFLSRSGFETGRCRLGQNIVGSISIWREISSRPLCRLCAFPCARTSKLDQPICISPERNPKLTRVLKLTPVQFSRVVSCTVAPRPRRWNCIGTVSVAWHERAAQLAAGDVGSVCTSYDNISSPLWVINVFLCQSIANQHTNYANHQNQGADQN